MKVFVECYHDMAVARSLGVTKNNLHHAYCKGNVINCLRKITQPAIGLVDADPGKEGRSSELGNYVVKNEAHGLRLLEHRQDRSKRVVEIDPQLEEWLVGRAQAGGIPLAKYGLPGTARDMLRNPHCDRKPGFQRFLSDLLTADEGMKTLKTWLVG